jgi:hypothetical protein
MTLHAYAQERGLPMNLTAIELAHDGLVDQHGLAASATSVGSRAAVRERSVRPTFPGSTGEVRLQAGALAMPQMTPTVDIEDPARVRFWGSPV